MANFFIEESDKRKKMKIFFVSSEVAPFAKTGGLADVSKSLPKALKDKEHDVRILMPKYGDISERKYVLREVIRLKGINVPIGDKVEIADVKSSFLPNSKVQVYFAGNKDYFHRTGYYVDPNTNSDWVDNAERFIFFSRSALEILKKLHWQPDIIHCNDWQTALIPFYLKTIFKDSTFFENTKTLLSIHNIAFQGVFDKDELRHLNINSDDFDEKHPLEFFGKLNFLKAGIICADGLNTVSNSYAKQILTTEEYGLGLQTLLKKRSKDFYGIINGVDYSEWNPERDSLIKNQYSVQDFTGKIENKRDLLKSQNLEFDEKIPVIGTISRLTDQKGFDIIIESLNKMMKLNLQYIILGTGETKYHKILKEYAEKYPEKLSVNLKYDNELAHRIEAGADIYLMPSKFEPCGLNQLYSLKYGTIPIVRSTGGLADTIKNWSQNSDSGFGFIFDEYSSEKLLETVNLSLNVYQNKSTWKKLMKRAMEQDFSWETVADKYLELYETLHR